MTTMRVTRSRRMPAHDRRARGVAFTTVDTR
jgi:hypothetical protein